jgi:metal-responsive CopG/Arc/MetJ family transcriptional regulator
MANRKQSANLKTGVTMSVSERLLAAIDAYITERGFGSRTNIVETALAEFLEKKGYKIEPSVDEMLAAIAKTRLKDDESKPPKKKGK